MSVLKKNITAQFITLLLIKYFFLSDGVSNYFTKDIKQAYPWKIWLKLARETLQENSATD